MFIDTVGRIVLKIKVQRAVASLPGLGRRGEQLTAVTRFPRRQEVKKKSTEFTVCTVRHICNTESLLGQTWRHTLLLTHKQKKSWQLHAQNPQHILEFIFMES